MGAVKACCAALLLLFAGVFCASCSRSSNDTAGTVKFLIESSPVNLDPRFATDSQSQRIDGLLFSGLVAHDERMEIRGDLAESWDEPNPLTYIFHLRRGVHFCDGRALTSADVKSTFEFILDPRNRSPKRGAFQMIRSIDAPDAQTVIFHLSAPYASFLWSMSRPAIGIVPTGSPTSLRENPVGSGPFRFVSQAQDDNVVMERNTDYFGAAPQIARVIFRVVPDAVVRALELRKGTADMEMSSLSPDMIPQLVKQQNLMVTERPGTNFQYLGVNMTDGVLAHREVRQALAFATDRAGLIRYLLHGEARVATGILPPNHWAYEGDVAQYPYDPARAEQLLDAAGFPRGEGGIRLRVALKTSTDEQARLMGAALQEEWRRVGVQLELRPLELATLLSDSVKGNYQLTLLRWVGANNDPDVFEYCFSSKRFPPDGANRGHYRNAEVDALTDQIRTEANREKRKALCSKVQKILAEDLPYIPLWFTDVVSVHKKRFGELDLSPAGDYEFLTSLGGA